MTTVADGFPAVAVRVAANIRAVRRARGDDLADVSERLELLGHPIGISALSKIELGKRRVDVADLVALSFALRVAPVRLLATGPEDSDVDDPEGGSPSSATGPDPCADIPDAPEPGSYRPAPGEQWRVGRKVGKNLYATAPGNPTGRDIGRMDTPELARFVMEAVNAELRIRDHRGAQDSHDPGGPPYPELMAVYRDAEALLAGRNANQPELLWAELRRMRRELDDALHAVGELCDQQQEGEGDG